MGGVSSVPYASLNLGAHVGDDLGAVEENRRRVLTAMGLSEFEDNLIVPNQVHGDNVCVIHSSDDHELARVRDEVAQGCDAVVCVASDVPVLMCFADCVPVILVTPHGFAVIHSGWRGTMAKLREKQRVFCSLRLPLNHQRFLRMWVLILVLKTMRYQKNCLDDLLLSLVHA